MGIETNPIENEANDILAESVNSFFGEEVKEDDSTEEVEEEDNNSEDGSEKDEDESSDDSEEDDSTEEVEEEEEIDEEEVDTAENLKGIFSKEYIKLLESISDPKLKLDLIDAGKKQRADLDRKRSELGEHKKLVDTLEETIKATNLPYNRHQYADYVKNLVSFDALFSKNPTLALESLAKTANLDLTKLGKPAQNDNQDDDFEDYRTPEEIKRDQEIETLKQELNLIKNQKQQEEQLTARQEIENFSNAVDSEGNLKYPHFDKVRKMMGIFFNDPESNITLEQAYQKAVRLDDELFEQEKLSIAKKVELKRKAEIEKAKKLRNQSVRSSKVSAKTYNPDVALEKIVGDFFG